MKRGDLYRVRRPPNDPKPARVFVVVGRQAVIDSRFSTVVCAPVQTTRSGLATEVAVGEEHGLKHASSVHCDGLVSLPKAVLTDFVGTLSAADLATLEEALRVALAVEC